MQNNPKKRLCSINGHFHSEIIMVCLQKQCGQNRLCCLHCVDTQHCKHDMVSFRKFYQLMQQNLQELNKNLQKGKILHLIEETEKQMNKKLKVIQNKVLEKLGQIQSNIQAIFSEIYLLFRIPSHQDMMQEIQENFCCETFDTIVSSFSVCQKYHFGAANQTDLVLAREIKTFKDSANQIKDNLMKSLSSFNDVVKKIDVSSLVQNSPPYFDHKSRYMDINVCDTRDIAFKNKSSSSRNVILADKPLNPINNQCRFKILKNGQGIPSISLGVAIKSIISKNGYHYTTGYQRGIYGIDQSSNTAWGSFQQSDYAVSWNHTQQGHCNTPLDFQLFEDDIVTVYIDYEMSTIVFEHEQDIHEMPINLSSKDLYPFVGFVYKDASVRMLDPYQE